MTKLFTAVILLFATTLTFAINVNSNDFSTKSIVRSKLWYEGIQFSSLKNQALQEDELIEEIAIPLNLLEQELL